MPAKRHGSVTADAQLEFGMPNTAQSRLHLLGAYALSPGDGPSYKKGWALLAYLAVDDRWHTREALIALLGLGSPGHFRQLLSNLRAALERPAAPPGLLTERNRVRLNPDYRLWVDAAAFLANGDADTGRLETRAALYRGEFLAGLNLADAPFFDEWLQIQRESLRLRALALAERLSGSHEASGNRERALGHARRVLELDPWSEAGHRRVMRLLAENGQSAAALAQYETCRARLASELGVLPDDLTRHLLAQIRNGTLTPPDRPQVPPPAQPVERRLATALYCELSMPGEADIEVLAEALRAPQARCEAIVRSRGGHVAQTHGGGILAYFGYPMARENAAREAVAAALDLLAAVAPPLAVRVGVHSGIIVGGPQPDMAGVTSALAVRVRDRASPGTALLSEATRQLVAGYFQLPPQGELHAPEHATPLRLFRIAGKSGAQTRLDAAQRLTPLVGRGAELADLVAAWQATRGGRHALVLVRGEAGIGKSRLIRALQERLAGAGGTVLELHCLPEYRSTPFHPLRAWHGARHGQTAAFDALLPAADDPAAPPRTQTLDALLDLLHREAGPEGLVLVVEDLHWCDPSTLELLARHARRPTARPLLSVFTARPEFVWPQDGDHLTRLELPPLNPKEMSALVRHQAPLSGEEVRRIVARADGIALFAEELARSAVERENPQATDAPPTLQELLASRLDGTGAAKPMAQLAATVGREFAVELVLRAAPAAADPRQALADLQDGGLLLAMPGGMLQFKHTLLQEAAYASQTRAQRRAAHRAIAQALLDAFPMRVRDEPEIVAHHLAQGGEALAAIDHWLRAGDAAAHRSANREALVHYEAGLALLPEIADPETRHRREFALEAHRGTVLVALHGYGAPAAHRSFSRAIELTPWAGDDDALFPAMFGLWKGAASNDHAVTSLAMADQLDRVARASGNPAHRIATDYAYGNNLFWLARFPEARARLEAAVTAHPEVGAERLIALGGEDSRILARSFLAWTTCFQGETDLARDLMEQTLAQARAGRHAHSLGFALAFAGTMHRHLDDAARTETLGRELMALAEKHGLAQWAASATLLIGWAMAAQGRPEGFEMVVGGAAGGSAAHRSVEATYGSFLLDALYRFGQYDKALACADHLLAVCRRNEDAYLVAEFMRTRAACLKALNPDAADEADALLQQALSLARAQGSVLLERRIAADLRTSSPARH